jgi:hypothetical protein
MTGSTTLRVGLDYTQVGNLIGTAEVDRAAFAKLNWQVR